MSANEDLPPTSWAVLGVLSFEEELSGYDVKRWADQSLAFFYWAPSQSQIYGELRRLERHGLAVSRVEQTHEARSRRLYAITDLGRERMHEWVEREAIDPVVLKHPLLLKVWAAHNGEPGAIVPRIREGIEQLRKRAERARGHAEGSLRNPGWRYSTIALEWSERYYLDEVRRLEWLIERLESELSERGTADLPGERAASAPVHPAA